MSDLVTLIGPANLATYVIAINFVAFAAFGIDKMLAEARRRRISEARLLQFAWLGGWPGAYAGRRLFRHKTRKQPFCNRLHAVPLVYAAVIGAVATWPYLA